MMTIETHEEKIARQTARNERCEKITAELKKMKVGFCGQKFGCLIWRIGQNSFSVGSDSVSINENFDLEQTARIVDNINGRR